MLRFTTTLTMGLAVARVVMGTPIADGAPAALITPAPVLKRSDISDPSFVGYALDIYGNVETFTCNTGTYTYSNGYAGCVHGAMSLGSRCSGHYITYFGGSTASCANYCATDLIYYSTNDMFPAWFVGCNTASAGIEILRTSYSSGPVPTRVTVISYVTPSAASTPVVSIPSSTSSPSSSPTSPTPPLTVTPTVNSKPNNGPIIGGVVGGACVVIGAVALGLFLFLRKRNNKTSSPGGFGNNQPAVVTQAPYQPPPAGAAPAMEQGYPSTLPSPQPYAPPYSPPPIYANDKSAAVTNTALPVQYEHRVPEGIQEVHGYSAPGQAATVQDNKGPRAGTTELA